jgi:FAD:protein FMN transferase
MSGNATWQALGTTVRLVLEGGDVGRGQRSVSDLLDEVDRTYSRFRPDSELSSLNARAGQRVPISPLLTWALAAALRGARLTHGLVDPTVGRAMRLIGYDRDFSLIDEGSNRTDASLRLEPVPGWQCVAVDVRGKTARFEPGVELDLGSAGKAFAADLAAPAALTASGADGALVSLGGDIAVAGTPPKGGWRVLVAEDSSLPPSAGGEVITLERGGIATSSTTVRRWTSAGVQLHHLVDPRSGMPATGPWRTATVVADTCLDANIAATAAMIMGRDAPAWLGERRLPARLVEADGTIHRLAGWPAPLEAVAS